MKNSLTNKIVAIVSFIGSVVSIIGFIIDHLKIKIPNTILLSKFIKSFKYIYINWRVYTLIFSLIIFFISLYVGYKTKKYNAKFAEKFNELIHYLSRIILKEYNIDYKYFCNLVKALYPCKNKSKINLIIFKRDAGELEKKIIYDTSNYDEWEKREWDKYSRIREIKRLSPDDYEYYIKYFKKRRIDLNNGIDDITYIYIYGKDKASFTKRKQKMIMPFLDTIKYLMSIVLEQQNERENVMQK